MIYDSRFTKLIDYNDELDPEKLYYLEDDLIGYGVTPRPLKKLSDEELLKHLNNGNIVFGLRSDFLILRGAKLVKHVSCVMHFEKDRRVGDNIYIDKTKSELTYRQSPKKNRIRVGYVHAVDEDNWCLVRFDYDRRD